MAQVNIWAAIVLLLVFKGLECADPTSPFASLSSLPQLDPVTLTTVQLKALLPNFIQEKVNRDNQTTRFIQLEDSLQKLDRCNRTNRQEVADMIKVVLLKEVELLAYEVFDLLLATPLIATASLSIVQLQFTPPTCARN